MIELARTLVRADTSRGGEAAAAAPIAAQLEAAGLEVRSHEWAPGRTSLVARLEGRGERPALCFTGHLDVVPAGEAPWARGDPFGGEVDGDRLHGRGSSDMKGGVAAIVAAVEELERGWTGAGAGIEVVLTSGEEIGCVGARSLAEAGLLGDVGAVLVAEPTANEPRIAHKGVLWLRAEAFGQLAHGSAPGRGVNAIEPLAAAVARLAGLDLGAPHRLLGSPTLNVGTFHGGANVNSVPDYAVAEIDVRTVPGVAAEELLASMRDRMGADVEVGEILSLPAVETNPSHPWVGEVCDVLEPLLGERPLPAGMAPFTDAAVLTPAYGGPPTIVCGPGEPDQAHRTDEWCSIARIEQAVEAYVEIARRWCGL